MSLWKIHNSLNEAKKRRPEFTKSGERWKKPGEGKIVLAMERTGNAKTGTVSCTYAPRQSCPGTCIFCNSGCYGEYAFIKTINRNIQAAAAKFGGDRIKIAEVEAESIRGLKGNLPLRVHIIGDCSVGGAARLVSDAVMDYQRIARMPSWAYTHAWRSVGRNSWGRMSVVASTESIDDVYKAFGKGYAACIVAESKEKVVLPSGIRLLPCPAITKPVQVVREPLLNKDGSPSMTKDGQQRMRNIEVPGGYKCVRCRLCMKAARLRQLGIVINFHPHGGEEAEPLIKAAIAAYRDTLPGRGETLKGVEWHPSMGIGSDVWGDEGEAPKATPFKMAIPIPEDPIPEEVWLNSDGDSLREMLENDPPFLVEQNYKEVDTLGDYLSRWISDRDLYRLLSPGYEEV